MAHAGERGAGVRVVNNGERRRKIIINMEDVTIIGKGCIAFTGVTPGIWR